MDYCEVVNQLLTVLVLIYNKTDTICLCDEMLQKYLVVDELIQQLIVREICADVGKVAQKLVVRQLTKVNTAMRDSKLQVTREHLPKN